MKTFIAIVVAGLAVGSASAQDRVVIDYTDTDLTTSASAGVLYTRILHAADAVCPQGQELGLNSHFIARKCARAAVAQAVEDVDNPLLTARHRGDTRDTLYSR
jgi:UrcA family protein